MRKTIIPLLIVVLLNLTALNAFAQEEMDNVLRMDLEEFKIRFAENSVVIIDVRIQRQYVNGHIPGALLMQLIDIESRLSELAEVTKPLVTYCS